MKFLKHTLLAIAIAGLGNAVSAYAMNADNTVQETKIHTIVLVHGAFADGSSWDNVIPALQSRHYQVIVVQNPMTSLADDVAATKRAIDQAQGDVILVGHSWGGTVITQAGNDPKVKGLVYVAGFAPSVGQSSADLGKNYPATPGSSKIQVTKQGYAYLPADAIADDFAQDAPAATKNLLAITQGPIRAANFDEKVTQAAWQNKPSWYVVSSNDRMINPQLERDMAKKIHAHVTELPASHAVMFYDPLNIARTIFKAVNITSGN